jgi:hypothetical protein
MATGLVLPRLLTPGGFGMMYHGGSAMGDGFSIDMGSALPYIVESVLKMFGKDAASAHWRSRLTQLIKLSLQEASLVQCVGMPEPIPIERIYQKTTIRLPYGDKTVDIDWLIKQGQDALIFAGPGCGKTTLLHWTYIRLLRDPKYLPLLFTLRWHDAFDDLYNLVSQLQSGRTAAPKEKTLVLLVDGYDEIKEEQRKRVSQVLMLFASLGVGTFYLTCRSHYNVYDLKCRHFELGPFSRSDAYQFVAAYSKAYGVETDGQALIEELEQHHLEEFSRHPLMLTLVCILKSGPGQEVPRRAIGLIRRAIDTLAFRWDEAKGIHRSSKIPLDGEERIRVLMRIAFDMNSLQEPSELVDKSVTAHLNLIQMKNVNVRDLLHEMARFYGILVPVGDGYWQFAHRTVHDYLSARYWVESGKFDPGVVVDWDIHAAYAAALTADATDAMILMLRRQRDTRAFTECIYNRAPFDSERVARAVIYRLEGVQFEAELLKGSRVSSGSSRKDDVLLVETNDDFYEVCSDEFLRVVLKQAALMRQETDPTFGRPLSTKGAEIAAVFATGELQHRKAKFRPKHLELFRAAISMPIPIAFETHVPHLEWKRRFSMTEVEALSKNAVTQEVEVATNPKLD